MDELISITLKAGQVLCRSKVERYSVVVLKVYFHQSIQTKKDSLLLKEEKAQRNTELVHLTMPPQAQASS